MSPSIWAALAPRVASDGLFEPTSSLQGHAEVGRSPYFAAAGADQEIAGLIWGAVAQ